MIPKLKSCKLRTKLLLLIFITGAFCILLFWLLWLNIGNAWQVAKNFPPFYQDTDALIAELREKASSYDVPEYNRGDNGAAQMEGFFLSADAYTGIYIYGMDGFYRASVFPDILNDLVLGTFIDWGTSLTDIYSHPPYADTFYTINFKNGPAEVYLRSYRNALFVYPYIIAIASLCIGIFFIVVLTYVNRRIKDILCLKQEILLMASGDLSHPVPTCGMDEIGTLGRELNHMRIAFAENIEIEMASRNANQDLITAMSHDLRTPLTILKGYLEVLKLNRNNASMADTYIDRCLKKADDVKEMTDKMFEYALVFEEEEEIERMPVSIDFLLRCLKENMDFLHLAGFSVSKLPELRDGTIAGDKAMLKRIFNNLFSNILKYGDKSVPISFDVSYEPLTVFNEQQKPEHEKNKMLILRLSNQIKSTKNPIYISGKKAESGKIASSGIGLKSVARMIALHQGSIRQWETSNIYVTELQFPLKAVSHFENDIPPDKFNP